jgi:hypothetical protein
MKTHTHTTGACVCWAYAPVEAIQFAKMEMRMDVAVRRYSAARAFILTLAFDAL